MSKKNGMPQVVKSMNAEPDSANSSEDEQDCKTYRLHQLKRRMDVPPMTTSLEVDGRVLEMEIDTGASVSLVSEKTFERLWPGKLLRKTNIKLRTYSNEEIEVVGEADVDVKQQGRVYSLSLVVVKQEGPSLIGRSWMQVIKLDWQQIHAVKQSDLKSILDTHEAVFRDELGTLKGTSAKIYVDKDATPRFCKARVVPYAMRKIVEDELDRLQQAGIIEPIQFAEWAAPIVPVMKADKSSMRICGDYKVTVNRAAKLDRYPIPKIEDLFATLSHGEKIHEIGYVTSVSTNASR